MVSGFQRVVLKQLAALKEGQKNILGELASVRELVSDFIASKTQAQQNYDFTTLPEFPLENEEQLDGLEAQLVIEDEYKLFVSIFVKQ